jgi:hypothetical protein
MLLPVHGVFIGLYQVVVKGKSPQGVLNEMDPPKPLLAFLIDSDSA